MMLNHPHTLEVSIGSRVKACRLKAGWTQAQLAKASAIPQGLITLYENDQRVPSALKLAALARAFEISMDDLVDRDDALPSPESEDRRVHGNSTAALLQRIATQLDSERQKGLLHHARLLMTSQEAEQAAKRKTTPKRRKTAA